MFTDQGFVNVVHKRTNESEWMKRVNKKVKSIHLRIVVTNVVGLPDAYYAGPNGTLWIEYKKTQHNRTRMDLNSLVRLAQLRWLTLFNACGHRTWVVVRNQDAFYIIKDLQEYTDKPIIFDDLQPYDVTSLAQEIDDTVGIFENCPWIARKRSPNHIKSDRNVGHIT